ncbi:MAG: DUF1622 domain-containing protein [Roseiarcus sp.]|jgi:uncharacterized membrane protein
MKEWLDIVAESAVQVGVTMALLVIAYGTIRMFVQCLRALALGSELGAGLRDGYLDYARWLIAGLTFLLAADIVETAIAPTWEDIGRLAAIAAIRTFLNFFLERDIIEARKIRDEDRGDVPRAK